MNKEQEIYLAGRCPCYYCTGTKLSDKLVKFVMDFESFIEDRITITSGARCPHYNQKVGGAVNSPHLIDSQGVGHAVDFVVNKLKPIEVAFKIEQFTQEGRTGIYQRHIHKDFEPSAPSKFWYVGNSYIYSQGVNNLYDFLTKLKNEGRLSLDDITTFNSIGSNFNFNKAWKI